MSKIMPSVKGVVARFFKRGDECFVPVEFEILIVPKGVLTNLDASNIYFFDGDRIFHFWQFGNRVRVYIDFNSHNAEKFEIPGDGDAFIIQVDDDGVLSYGINLVDPETLI